jgi:hypothetical protein
MARWTIDDGVVWIKGWADSTRDDVIGAIGQAAESERFARGMGLLIDTRSMTPETEVLPHRIRASATAIASLGFGRCAIVAKAPKRVEQSEIFAAYAELRELDTEVFDDDEAALRWLTEPAG